MTTEPSTLWIDGLSIETAEAVIISAIAGGLVALLVVRKQRGIAKRAKAYDVAERFLHPRGQYADQTLRKMAAANNWATVIGTQMQQSAATRQRALGRLNEWELMCVGIRKGILDESVLKDSIGDRLVIIFGSASAVIKGLRQQKNDNEYYEHFEFIAKRWNRSGP